LVSECADVRLGLDLGVCSTMKVSPAGENAGAETRTVYGFVEAVRLCRGIACCRPSLIVDRLKQPCRLDDCSLRPRHGPSLTDFPGFCYDETWTSSHRTTSAHLQEVYLHVVFREIGGLSREAGGVSCSTRLPCGGIGRLIRCQLLVGDLQSRKLSKCLQSLKAVLDNVGSLHRHSSKHPPLLVCLILSYA
jgi:hypothetical protein